MASHESMPLEGRAAIVKDLSLIAFTCGIWAAPPPQPEEVEFGQRLRRNLMNRGCL